MAFNKLFKIRTFLTLLVLSMLALGNPVMAQHDEPVTNAQADVAATDTTAKAAAPASDWLRHTPAE